MDDLKLYKKTEKFNPKSKYHLLDTQEKIIIQSNNDITFLLKAVNRGRNKVIDNYGFDYFRDGTGSGFIACQVFKKDIEERLVCISSAPTELYNQNNFKFKQCLKQARHLKIFVGSYAVKMFIQNKRQLKLETKRK